MKIPKSYQLADNTIKIEMVSDRFNSEYLGKYFKDRNLIMLQSPNDNIDSQCVELTFYHELVHSILKNLKYTELNEDEVFVDRFALLLKQAINTMEFEQ